MKAVFRNDPVGLMLLLAPFALLVLLVGLVLVNGAVTGYFGDSRPDPGARYVALAVHFSLAHAAMIVMGAAGAGFAVYLIKLYSDIAGKWLLLAGGLVLLLGVAVALYSFRETAGVSGVVGNRLLGGLFEALPGLNLLMSLTNVFAVICFIVAMLASCALIHRSLRQGFASSKELRRAMLRFRGLVVVSSITLVLAVAEVFCLYRLAANFSGLTELDNAILISGITLAAASVFSFLLLIGYVPAGLRLQQCARILWEERPPSERDLDPAEWFQKHQLELTWSRFVTAAAAIVSPLVTGFVAQIFV